MKKTLSMILSAVLLAGLATAASAWEKGVDYVVIEEVDPDNYVGYADDYPGSTEWDWPACRTGQLLQGTIISSFDPEQPNNGWCWKNSPASNASAAFDGDMTTMYDPFTAGEKAWMGVILDQAYQLTEIRVATRGKYLERLNGATIQGSNDGVQWVNIMFYGQNAIAEDYHIFTPVSLEDDDRYAEYVDAGAEDFSQYWVTKDCSFKMYRLINMNSQHGEALELELYGIPAPATKVTWELMQEANVSIESFYNFPVDYEFYNKYSADIDGSVVGHIIGGYDPDHTVPYSPNPDSLRFWQDYQHQDGWYGSAWDNDTSTKYDPAGQSHNFWTGIMVDAPTALKSVKVMPRDDRPERLNGGRIQGSNDGIRWYTLASFNGDDVPDVGTFTWVEKTVDTDKEFTMFRYVNKGTNHGDVVDIALYPLVKAPAKVSDANNFYGTITYTGVQAPKVADNSIVGEIVGGAEAVAGNEFDKAFDGSLSTFWNGNGAIFDMWVGIRTSEPAVAKSFTIATQDDNADGISDRRHAMWGSRLQGSNDGMVWEDIYVYEYADFEDYANDEESSYLTIEFENDKAYTFFRYLNNDDGANALAELQIFAEGAAAETAAPETAAPETAAPETAAPETAAPETAAPETAAPETAAPETAAPETAAPETDAPEVPKVSDVYNYYGTITYTGAQAPAVAENSIVGEIIGNAAQAEGYEFAKAFDGNMATWWNGSGAIFDMWVGIKAAQPMVAKSFTIATQDNEGDGVADRRHAMWGSRLQGSNDGITWEDLYIYEYVDFEDYANDEESSYLTIEFENDKAYTYFRYLNNDDGANAISELQIFGDVAEAPQTFDAGVIAAVAAVISAAGYAIARKRK